MEAHVQGDLAGEQHNSALCRGKENVSYQVEKLEQHWKPEEQKPGIK